jgi:hypothetical protein
LNRLAMTIAVACRTANINPQNATILPKQANPPPDGIFGKDRMTDADMARRHTEVFLEVLLGKASPRNKRHERLPGVDRARATLFNESPNSCGGEW